MATQSASESDEGFKLATIQRQRSILLYDAFCRPENAKNSTATNLQIKLYDSKPLLPAQNLSAVDSSESKFAITGFQTNWGLHKGTLCIRGSDIAYIDLDLK